MVHTVIEDAESEYSDGAPACLWCGRRLLPEEREWHVCERCVSLLRDKGLVDDEIFGLSEQK
jgi:hypothetical protein